MISVGRRAGVVGVDGGGRGEASPSSLETLFRRSRAVVSLQPPCRSQNVPAGSAVAVVFLWLTWGGLG